jgi:hypothetical protein
MHCENSDRGKKRALWVGFLVLLTGVNLLGPVYLRNALWRDDDRQKAVIVVVAARALEERGDISKRLADDVEWLKKRWGDRNLQISGILFWFSMIALNLLLCSVFVRADEAPRRLQVSVKCFMVVQLAGYGYLMLSVLKG